MERNIGSVPLLVIFPNLQHVETTTIGRIIAAPKLLLDHLSHSLGGPDLSTKAEDFASFANLFLLPKTTLTKWTTRIKMTAPTKELTSATCVPGTLTS